MTPYYDEGGITIYHGDCREILPLIATSNVALVRPRRRPPMGRVVMASSRLLLRCQDFVLGALRCAPPRGNDLSWIEREREIVAIATNSWAEAHGFTKRVTVADVERVETRAVGHVDYASKLALYMAEIVTQSGS